MQQRRKARIRKGKQKGLSISHVETQSGGTSPAPQDPSISSPLLLPGYRGSRQSTAISGSMVSTSGAGTGREPGEGKGHLTSRKLRAGSAAASSAARERKLGSGKGECSLVGGGEEGNIIRDWGLS